MRRHFPLARGMARAFLWLVAPLAYGVSSSAPRDPTTRDADSSDADSADTERRNADARDADPSDKPFWPNVIPTPRAYAEWTTTASDRGP